MNFNKSIVIKVSPKEVQELLRAILGEPKKQTHVEGFSHPVLVSVKSGDGIGFDAGEYVAVTNAKNNVGMLFKANYDNPFQIHSKLLVSDTPVFSKDELIPGHTYMVESNGEAAFVKYLGHSMVLIRACNALSVATITTNDIPAHYEISTPVPTSK